MATERTRSLGILVAFVLLVVCAGFVAYSYLSPNGFIARKHSDVRKIEPENGGALTTLDGSVFSVKAYEGDVIIVSSWASWSPFAPEEFQNLRDIKKEFGDRVHVVAVNRMESKETAIAYLDTIGRPEGVEIILDPTDHFFDAIQGYAMPETLLYDAYGTIALHVRGTLNPEEVRSVIGNLLVE